MLRKDREIKTRDEIIDVLNRCETLSIGLYADEFPYVVAVSFGFVDKDGVLTVYFHGAGRGQKVAMLEKNPNVCIEGHIFYKVEAMQNGLTARYESIIGFGVAERVFGDELIVGLKSITEHYAYPDYPVEKCRELPITFVYKIIIDSITGKRNLPE